MLKSLRPEVYREIIRTEAKNLNVHVDGDKRIERQARIAGLSNEAREECEQAIDVLKGHGLM